ncbi:hypothetical protein A2U01_0094037, partial [Trifolium medium]|nr:hypothetical protein [Trifolium medium]
NQKKTGNITSPARCAALLRALRRTASRVAPHCFARCARQCSQVRDPT